MVDIKHGVDFVIKQDDFLSGYFHFASFYPNVMLIKSEISNYLVPSGAIHVCLPMRRHSRFSLSAFG
jgi:hypothetical protein